MGKLKLYIAITLGWIAVQLIKAVYWLADGTEIHLIKVDGEVFYPF